MDEKLARGLARELFRRLTLTSKAATSPRSPLQAELVRKYHEDGGVQEWDVLEIASRFDKDMQSVGEATTNLRLIRHPVRRKAILETSFPACVEGSEQSWLILPSNTFVLEKNTLKIIETVHHAAIAQHAVFRLYERGTPEQEGLAQSILAQVSLWTYPLLFSLSGETARRPAMPGDQIAIPYANGLLLGTLEINHLDGPDQGPTISTCKLGGHKLRRIVAPFAIDGDAILTLSINTFVGRQELFENQQKILEVIEEFESRYRSSMSNMRQLVAFGYPDDEITRLIGSPKFNSIDLGHLLELANHIQEFFDSTEWKQHAEAHRRPTRFLH